MKLLLILCLGLGLIGFSQPKLLSFQEELGKLKERPEREVLYLPDGTGLRFLSFGYQNFVADLLWFQTISYFGKHYRMDRNYTWLNHMCHLVVNLNPRARHVVEFCGMMLSWEAEKPIEALSIISKGIESEPDYWNYYYLKGFTEFYFLKNPTAAQRSFQTGSELPDAPTFLARLAAEKMLSSDPSSAIRFLSQMIQQAESGERALDEMQLASLKDKLRESIHEFNIEQLEKGVDAFRQQRGVEPVNLAAVVQAGFIRAIPEDPYGGSYFLDSLGLKVQSSGWIERRKRREQ